MLFRLYLATLLSKKKNSTLRYIYKNEERAQTKNDK